MANVNLQKADNLAHELNRLLKIAEGSIGSYSVRTLGLQESGGTSHAYGFHTQRNAEGGLRCIKVYSTPKKLADGLKSIVDFVWSLEDNGRVVVPVEQLLEIEKVVA